MAVDEALLESAAEGSSAVVRLYGWSVPTLSLGYFQRIADVDADPIWKSVPVVRRATGGGAIWHEGELTYAVMVPPEHALSRRASDLYRVIHNAIAGVISSRGAQARRRGDPGTKNVRNRPFLCFTDRDPEDIVVAEAKIVGSAQRRRLGAVLQHGSVLLATSPMTPELPGLEKVAGIGVDVSSWSHLFRRQIADALGLPAREDRMSHSERDRAEVLSRQVYRTPEWTRKR
jgi:lipoyl(octanoyl) transferase